MGYQALIHKYILGFIQWFGETFVPIRYTHFHKCISLDAHLDLIKVMRCSTNRHHYFYSCVLSCLAFAWKWGYSWPCDLHWPYFSPEEMKLTKMVWKGTLRDTSSCQHAYMHELVVILDQHNWLCCLSCSVLRSDFFSIIILNLNRIKSKQCNTNNY